MKYVDLNLIKYMQDLYAQGYKTLMKGIKDNLNKLRHID